MAIYKNENGTLSRKDASAASQIGAIDTENILGGGAGAQTNTQALLDALAEGGGGGGGLPAGGSADDMLVKNSSSAGDASWKTPAQVKTILGVGDGHTIQNASGTDMTARAGLQFLNANVADDSTNDKTIVSTNAGLIPATDTENLLGGGAGATSTTQALLDEIADRVADKLLTKTDASSLYLPQSVQNVVGSKNLLPNNASTQAIHGVTFTVNSDGSITISGTASAETFLFLDSPKYRPYPVGDYICSQNIQTTGLCGLFIGEYSSADTSAFVENLVYLAFGHENKTCAVDYSGYDYLAPYIYMAQGTSISGTIKPMLRPASYKDSTYEPYAMTNRELTAVRTGTVTAISNNYGYLNTTANPYVLAAGRLGMCYFNIMVTSTLSDNTWIKMGEISGIIPIRSINIKPIDWGNNTFAACPFYIGNDGSINCRPKMTGNFVIATCFITK